MRQSGQGPSEDPRKHAIDERIQLLFTKLGYYLFPFHAFKPDGSLHSGQELDIPAELKRDLAVVTQKAEWELIYSRLSALGQPGAPEALYTLGIAFGPSGVALMPVKALDSIPAENIHREGPRMAANFMNSLGVGSLKRVQELAGQRYEIRPEVLKKLKTILGAIREAYGDPGGQPGQDKPPNEQPASDDGGTPFPPPPGGGGGFALGDELPAVEKLSPVLALKLLDGLLTSAGELERGQFVTALLIWYPPASWGKDFAAHAEDWKPLLRPKPFWDGNRRAISLIWDPAHGRHGRLWGHGDDDDWAGRPSMHETLAEVKAYLTPYGAAGVERHEVGDGLWYVEAKDS